MSPAVALWTWLSPLLIVVGAGVLVLLERWRPYEPRQRVLRAGFWDDLIGYTFVQSYVLGLVIAHITGWLDHVTGLSRHHLVGAWPVPVQVLFFLVTHDFYIYCFHRLQHRSSLLWRIHEAHHATANVDWLSGSRSHALEILINQTIEFAPILLLGASPEVALIKVTIDALWGMYIHANVDVRSGRLQLVINGPEMHRWHHAFEIKHGVNFSTKLAFWDYLFRTAHRPTSKPMAYGLEEPFPAHYLAQQWHAFTKRQPTVTPATPSTIASLSTDATSP